MSILNDIKKLLGVDSECTHFDQDIILYINSALMNLTQLGVGPKDGYIITGPNEIWGDFIGDRIDIECVKTYVYLKVRFLFDPPQNSFLIESSNKIASEMEWRILHAIETKEE